MAPFAPRVVTVALAAVATLGILAAPAAAQSVSSGDPYNTIVSTAASPYWGYTYNPYAYVNVGDVIRAQGDFLIKREEAALLRLQVREARLITRRKELEHWEWERDFQSGALNRERERVRVAEVERGRNFPPLTEILAAVPLNNLLDELVKQPALPGSESAPVESEWLAHVHVTVDGRGNVGLLKGDKIFWPQLLARSGFAAEREQIDQLFARAKEQALAGRSDPEVLDQLRRRVAVCLERVRQGANDPAWNMRQYVEAKRLLKQMDDAIVVLEKPDAAFYLNPLRGETVADLVKYMKKEGVRFAPATLGCERYYIALHRALADEVTRLQGPAPSSKNP